MPQFWTLTPLVIIFFWFRFQEGDDAKDVEVEHEDVCHASNFEDCKAPSLQIMLGGLNTY